MTRAIRLMRRLESGSRWTLEELARLEHYSARTVRRDLYALRAAGLNVQAAGEEDYGRANPRRWWIAPTSSRAQKGRTSHVMTTPAEKNS